MCLVADGNDRFATQDVLLVLQRVCVPRHSPSLLHGELPQCKVGSFLRRDQDLDGRILAGSHGFRFNLMGMLD
jgi:hypothetical protein